MEGIKDIQIKKRKEGASIQQLQTSIERPTVYKTIKVREITAESCLGKGKRGSFKYIWKNGQPLVSEAKPFRLKKKDPQIMNNSNTFSGSNKSQSYLLSDLMVTPWNNQHDQPTVIMQNSPEVSMTFDRGFKKASQDLLLQQSLNSNFASELLCNKGLKGKKLKHQSRNSIIDKEVAKQFNTFQPQSLKSVQKTFIYLKSNSSPDSQLLIQQSNNPKRSQKKLQTLQQYAIKLKKDLKSQGRDDDLFKTPQMQRFNSTPDKEFNQLKQLQMVQLSPFKEQSSRNLPSLSIDNSLKLKDRAIKEENSFLKKVFKSTAQLSNHRQQFAQFNVANQFSTLNSQSSQRIEDPHDDSINIHDIFHKGNKDIHKNPFKQYSNNATPLHLQLPQSDQNSFGNNDICDSSYNQQQASTAVAAGLDHTNNVELINSLSKYQKQYSQYKMLLKNYVPHFSAQTYYKNKPKIPTFLDEKQLKQIFLNHLRDNESKLLEQTQHHNFQPYHHQNTNQLLPSHQENNNHFSSPQLSPDNSKEKHPQGFQQNHQSQDETRLLLKSRTIYDTPSDVTKKYEFKSPSAASLKHSLTRNVSPFKMSPQNSLINPLDGQIELKTFYKKRNTLSPSLFVTSNESLKHSNTFTRQPTLKKQKAVDIYDERKEFLDYLKRKWLSKRQEYQKLGYKTVNIKNLTGKAMSLSSPSKAKQPTTQGVGNSNNNIYD